jgi:hypothetical protein
VGARFYARLGYLRHAVAGMSTMDARAPDCAANRRLATRLVAGEQND